MKMWIYLIRRLALLVPVLIGVMTITFVLVSALPTNNRLIAAFGSPPLRSPWIYDPTLSPGTGPCPSNATSPCPNPVYQNDLHILGLDQPIPVQWGVYIYHTFTFQWGTVSNHSSASNLIPSLRGLEVTTVLSWYLPYTLELAVMSLLIILVVSIPLGNLSAVNRNRPIDQASRVMSFSGYAMPGFLLASLVLMAFVIGFGSGTGYVLHPPWCPSGESTFTEFTQSWPGPGCFSTAGNFAGGYPTWILHNGIQSTPSGFPTVDALVAGQYWLALDTVVRMILPALVIAFGTIAVLLRFVRNSMLEVMNLDFVRTARSEGVPERTVIRRHAGRNSLNVTITVMGLLFAFFIGGFPVIEDVFHLNGVGLMLAYSVQQTSGPVDFALIFGTTILFTFIIVLANIIVDVLYAYLDPRVRLG
jgi:ABC-type dipeptide/oligopeptide/nickel transport system permease component